MRGHCLILLRHDFADVHPAADLIPMSAGSFCAMSWSFSSKCFSIMCATSRSCRFR